MASFYASAGPLSRCFFEISASNIGANSSSKRPRKQLGSAQTKEKLDKSKSVGWFFSLRRSVVSRSPTAAGRRCHFSEVVPFQFLDTRAEPA